MAKDKIAYVCSHCGQESAKWVGKCPSCGQWNTFKEIRLAPASKATATASHAVDSTYGNKNNRPQRLRDISSHDEPRTMPNSTGCWAVALCQALLSYWVESRVSARAP